MAWTARVRGVWGVPNLRRHPGRTKPGRGIRSGREPWPVLSDSRVCVTLHASPHILRDRFIPALHVRDKGDKEDTGRSLAWEGDSSSLQPWTEVGSLVVPSS